MRASRGALISSSARLASIWSRRALAASSAASAACRSSTRVPAATSAAEASASRARAAACCFSSTRAPDSSCCARVGGVDLGLRDRVGLEQLVRARGVELGLRELRLGGVEARVRGRDLLAAGAGVGLRHRGARLVGAGARGGDLLGARAAFELVVGGLRLRRLCLRERALRQQVARLEHDQHLAGLHAVALARLHLLDAAADARADGDGADLDGAGPLERLVGEVPAVAEVDPGEHGERDEGDEASHGRSPLALAVPAVDRRERDFDERVLENES
jgi:hypothetical protein